MTPYLRPCPFCGSRVTVVTRPGAPSDDALWFAFVVCYCCGYSAGAHQAGQGDTPLNAEKNAAAKWNTRSRLTTYRVWPDGTVQEVSEHPYSWLSDDYLVVQAVDEENAVAAVAAASRFLAEAFYRPSE